MSDILSKTGWEVIPGTLISLSEDGSKFICKVKTTHMKQYGGTESTFYVIVNPGTHIILQEEEAQRVKFL